MLMKAAAETVDEARDWASDFIQSHPDKYVDVHVWHLEFAGSVPLGWLCFGHGQADQHDDVIQRGRDLADKIERTFFNTALVDHFNTPKLKRHIRKLLVELRQILNEAEPKPESKPVNESRRKRVKREVESESA